MIKPARVYVECSVDNTRSKMTEDDLHVVAINFASQVHGVITDRLITDDDLWWRVVIDAYAEDKRLNRIADQTIQQYPYVDIGWFDRD
jgi:hypothetical protein